jgi:hypothetical protein
MEYIRQVNGVPSGNRCQCAGLQGRSAIVSTKTVPWHAPSEKPDQENPEWVLIGGRRKRFSDEVSEVLLDPQAAP